MAQHAYQSYQGSDWQTYRYSAAQVFDLLDQVRDVTGVLLSGDPATARIPCFEPLNLLNDLCSDLVGAVDMVLADLAVTLQSHLPSRWLMVELRTIIAQLPELLRHTESDDHDNIPVLADRAERVRHLLQRLDG